MTEISKCSLCLVQLNPGNFQQIRYKFGDPLGCWNGEETDKEEMENLLINPQVKVIYLVHNILDIPLEQCSKYLEKYGNPADWVTLCHSCATTLENARDLSRQIVQLQNRLGDLKQLMRNQMRVKDEDPEGTRYGEDGKFRLTAAYEIRQYMSLLTHRNHVEDLVDEKSDLSRLSNPSVHLQHVVDLGFKNDTSMFIDESRTESIILKEEEPEFENFSLNNSISTNDNLQWTFMEGINPQPEDFEEVAVSDMYQQNSTHSYEDDDSKFSNNSSDEDESGYPDVSVSNSENQNGNKLGEKTFANVYNSSLLDFDEGPIEVRKTPVPKTYGKPISQNAKTHTYSFLKPIQKLPLSYPCKDCTEVLTTPNKLANHVNVHHTEGIRCSVSNCRKVLFSITGLERHIRAWHHPKEVAACTGCNIRGAYAFNNHLKNNPKCSAFAIPCTLCTGNKKYLSTKESLNIHMEIYHVNPPLYKFSCPSPNCGKRFHSKQYLSTHVAENHAEKKSFPCTKCGKDFATVTSLRRHFKDVHLCKPGTREDKFPCDVCDGAFSSKTVLREHMKVHDTPFLCLICGKRFRYNRHLKTHLWYHESRRFQKSFHTNDQNPKTYGGKDKRNSLESSTSECSKMDSAGQLPNTDNLSKLNNKETL